MVWMCSDTGPEGISPWPEFCYWGPFSSRKNGPVAGPESFSSKGFPTMSQVDRYGREHAINITPPAFTAPDAKEQGRYIFALADYWDLSPFQLSQELVWMESEVESQLVTGIRHFQSMMEKAGRPVDSGKKKNGLNTIYYWDFFGHWLLALSIWVTSPLSPPPPAPKKKSQKTPSLIIWGFFGVHLYSL